MLEGQVNDYYTKYIGRHSDKKIPAELDSDTEELLKNRRCHYLMHWVAGALQEWIFY